MTDSIDFDSQMQELTKLFSKGAVFIADSNELSDIKGLSTGSIGLDYKIGIGGIPKGYITEIIGPNATGKTTLCLQLAISAQKENGVVGYIDAEHELNLHYAKALGVDLSRLMISQPDTMEEGLELLEKMAESNKFALIVFDSIAALPTKAELENTISDLQVGDKARLLSKHFRRINNLVGQIDSAIVYINQIRDNISFGFGSKISTPGGHGIKFRAKLRIDLKCVTSKVMVGDEAIGTRIRATLIKNKVGAPFGEWEYTIVFGKGIVSEFDLVEIGEKIGIIKKSGAWFSFDGENIGQGIWKTMDNLQRNPELRARIENKVRDKMDGVVYD